MATVTKKAAAAAELAEQCRRLYLPVPTHFGDAKHELMFAKAAVGRNWRFDVAWNNLRRIGCGPFTGPKLALEIDGGVFGNRMCPRCKGAGGFLKVRCVSCKGTGRLTGGRHNTGQGYRDDAEKLAEAIILGWYVFRCLPEQIKSGVVIGWLDRFFYAHHVLLPPCPTTFHRRTYSHDTTQDQ